MWALGLDSGLLAAPADGWGGGGAVPGTVLQPSLSGQLSGSAVLPSLPSSHLSPAQAELILLWGHPRVGVGEAGPGPRALSGNGGQVGLRTRQEAAAPDFMERWQLWPAGGWP